MQAWLLALVLVIVCAIGAYYVHNTYSGINDYEGFDASGNPILLKKAADALCEKEYQACLKKSTNATCTAIYNKCNAAAQALDTTISATSKAGSSTTTSSGPGAIAYAKNLGMAGAGDAVSFAKSGGLVDLQYGNASPFDIDPTTTENTLDTQLNGSKHPIDFKLDIKTMDYPKLSDEKEVSDLSMLAAYTAYLKKHKPHETPSLDKRITAKLASDIGTEAEDGVDTNLSLRSQIRREIQKTVREEVDNVNKYQVKYEEAEAEADQEEDCEE